MLKILLVEDSAIQRNMVVNHLSSRGHNVLTASTIDMAIETYKNNSPIDLVIADVNLEFEDGIDLVKDLHRSYPGEFKSLIVSSLNVKPQILRAREAGAMAWIVKPIPFDKLDKAIEKLFYSEKTVELGA